MISIIIAIITVAIDQITKHFAIKALMGKESFDVIGGVLRFTYVENTGAAFGMFSDSRVVFMTASVLIIFVLCYIVFKFRGQSVLFDILMGLLLGGGVGNMIDRVRLGYVVDFIDFYAFDFWKYVFNVADSAVVIGCVLAVIYVIYDTKTAKAAAGRVENEGDGSHE